MATGLRERVGAVGKVSPGESGSRFLDFARNDKGFWIAYAALKGRSSTARPQFWGR